jgi:glycosyltransferase involved in cell wall biosynthesis
MIPTFNPDPGHLAEALASVLAQDPGPAEMEIAVIDDHSREADPPACLSTAPRRRVSWLRQERHTGIAGNWNACIRRARGRWVHILHQDDLVRPGFYASLRDGIDAAPAEVGAAFCRDVVIGPDGRRRGSQVPVRETPGPVEDWVEHVFVELHLRAPAIAVKRAVYETIGGFSPEFRYALDWDMWKRIASRYRLWHEPAELACYRRHSGSATFGFMRSGANIAEIRRSIELSEAMLDPAIAADVTRRTRATYTRYAARSAWRSIKERRLISGLAQLREAAKLRNRRGLRSP